MLPSKNHLDEARAAFEGAYFTGAVTDFVTERQIESGKLARYKLVIVPRASHAPDGVVKALNEYIRNGGTVMTVGPCFTQDEYGRVQQQALVSAERGRLVAYPDPLTAHAYRDILDRLLDQAGASRPIRIAGAHGEPVWGVNVRATEENGRLLVNLLNLSRVRQQVQLVTKPAAKNALNLMDGKQIEFPFTLSPLEPVVLALRLR